MKAAYILANGTRYSTETAREMKLKELCSRVHRARPAGREAPRPSASKPARTTSWCVWPKRASLYVSAPVGAPSSIPNGAMPVSFEDKDGNFDPENVRRFIQNRLGRTVEEFANSQIQETLAQRMRESCRASVVVSPGEVWDAYVREKDKVELKYVRFDPAHYREQRQAHDRTSSTPGSRSTRPRSTPSSTRKSTATPGSRSRCARATS